MMKRLLIGGLAVLATACAPTPTAQPTASSPSPVPSSELAIMRQLSQCLRTHGVPGFPDPVVNPQTNRPEMPANLPPVTAAAKTACGSIARSLPGGNKEKEATAAQLQALRRFAQCMRDQGMPDWPDPDPRGAFPLNDRLKNGGKRLFLTQMRACAKYNIENGIKVSRPET